MMHVQLRRYLPDAVTPAEVLDVQEIQFAGSASATKTVTFKTSLVVGEGIRDWIEDHPGQAFIVAVEYSVDGGEWVEPRNARFVAYKGDQDDADPTETMSITGMDWMSWQLARTYLHWARSAKNNERAFTVGGTAQSAGYIMNLMLNESTERGWGPQVDWDFTAAADSAGSAWSAAEKVKTSFRMLTPLSQALGTLTEQGLCDWWVEGTELRLFRPGVGEDRTEVVLGGAGFSRAPGAWDFSGVFTNLTVVPEKARNWLYLVNTGADTSFGRLEATMTQSGVADHPTATTLAQPTLIEGRAAKREQSYEWTVAGDMPRPWVDFNEHDLVTIDTAFGTREERIIELVVRVRDDVVTCVAITGDKMLSAVAKRDRRAQSAVIGNIVGGSGNGLPGAGGPALSVPAAPTGLHVESNVGTWRTDGTAQATVELRWDAVSQAEDTSEVDVAGYEVAHRSASSDLVIEAVDGVSFTTSAWEPDAPRFAKVRALPQSGDPGAWSEEISVTPAVPSGIVPEAPTGLAVASNTATFGQDGTATATVTVSWSAVTQSVEGELLDVAEYEVLVGEAAQRVTGLSATFTIPSGAEVPVRVSALTTIGVWGDPSAVLDVTGALPSALDVSPSEPVLTPGMGGVAYRYDGLSSTGAAMPAGWARVVVRSGVTAAGPWTALGATLSAPGGGSISAEVGAEVFVRFQAFDTLGRPMGVSAVRSAIAAGVPLTAIPGLEADLDGIRHTSDGKNRVYLSVTDPQPAEAETGRNIFANPQFVDGSVNGLYSSSTEVTAGGVLTVSAGVNNPTSLMAMLYPVPVAAGLPFSAKFQLRRKAGMTASRTMSLRPTAYLGGSGVSWTQVGVGNATVVLADDSWQDIEFSGWVQGATGNTVGIQFVPLDGMAIGEGYEVRRVIMSNTLACPDYYDGDTLASGTRRYAWAGTQYLSPSVEYTTSDGSPAMASGDLWLQLAADGASVVAVKVWNGTSWAAQVIYAQDIVAVGSIIGTLIRAGTIEVNHVSPTFGEDLDLSANGSVNILVGTVNDLQGSINGQQETIDLQAAQIAAAQAAATAAASGASSASIAAAAAKAAAATAQAGVDKYGTVFAFKPDGLEISSPGSPMSLKVSNADISIRRDGVARTIWDENQMIVPKLQSAQVVVGATVITEKPGGMTWQRL